MKKIRVLSSFWLKIIALACMSIDHIGVQLGGYFLPSDDPIYLMCRIIGRLALPLFAFMIFQGVIHTSNFKKYILRLSIMALMITIALIGLKYIPLFKGSGLAEQGNIFLDLTLGAIGIYCLKNERWYIKLLSILPIAYAISSFCAVAWTEQHSGEIYWLPFFLRLQYGFYGIGMIYSFYFAYLASNYFTRTLAIKSGLDKDAYINTSIHLDMQNIAYLFIPLILTSIFVLISDLVGYEYLQVQMWAIISGALILLYSHQRGYNRKWFEYGSYLYYPIHLILLGVIFYLITL